jgi:hypothetical protein
MTGDHFADRRRALGSLAGGGLVAAVALAVNRAHGAEGDVDLKKVPKVVMNAAERILPKATWHSAVKVVDGAKVAYELDGSAGKDRDVTVMVTAEGKVVEVETELKNPSNVPDKVLAAVKAKWPRFTPTETHQIRQGKDLQGARDGDHVYDMRGTIAKGRDVQVQVAEDGEILESTVEVPLDKVPAAVTEALKKARPKFDIGAAYTIHEGEKLIGYHFEGKGPKGRDRTISVTPDGKQVEVVE